MKIGAKAKGECLKQSSSQRGARVLAFWATARDSHATRLAKSCSTPTPVQRASKQLLISWRAVALRRPQFLFQLMDLLTERRLRDMLPFRGLKHCFRLSAFQFFSVSAFGI